MITDSAWNKREDIITGTHVISFVIISLLLILFLSRKYLIVQSAVSPDQDVSLEIRYELFNAGVEISPPRLLSELR